METSVETQTNGLQYIQVLEERTTRKLLLLLGLETADSFDFTKHAMLEEMRNAPHAPPASHLHPGTTEPTSRAKRSTKNDFLPASFFAVLAQCARDQPVCRLSKFRSDLFFFFTG